MTYEKLDNEELLRLALDAIRGDRDADGVVMLKVLLDREPDHVYARYLLAAQHAEMGLHDRAEAGFRAVVAEAPDFPIARFQLGQVLAVKGAYKETSQVLEPLTPHPGALGAYAKALTAAVGDDTVEALEHLEAGLSMPQEIPALAADMQRLLEQLRQQGQHDAAAAPPAMAAVPMFLSGYGRGE